MEHTTQSTDDTREFGRMVEMRNGSTVWSGRGKFATRQRDLALTHLVMMAAGSGELTIVLTP